MLPVWKSVKSQWCVLIDVEKMAVDIKSTLFYVSVSLHVRAGGLCITQDLLSAPPPSPLPTHFLFSLHLKCWTVWVGDRSHQGWRMSHGPAVNNNKTGQSERLRYGSQPPSPACRRCVSQPWLVWSRRFQVKWHHPPSLGANPLCYYSGLPFYRRAHPVTSRGRMWAGCRTMEPRNVVDINLKGSRDKYRK